MNTKVKIDTKEMLDTRETGDIKGALELPMTNDNKDIFKKKQIELERVMGESLLTSISRNNAILNGLNKLLRDGKLVKCRSVYYVYLNSGTKWIMLGYGLSCSVLADMVGFNTTVNYEASILPMIQNARTFSWQNISPNYSFCFKDGRYSWKIYENGRISPKVRERYMPQTYSGRNFCCNPMSISSIGVRPRDFREDLNSPLVKALLRSMSVDRLEYNLSFIADIMTNLEGYSRPTWNFLIGPPDSGKTLFLDMISSIVGPSMGRINSDAIWNKVDHKEKSKYGFYRALRFPDTDIRRLSIESIKAYAGNDVYMNHMGAPSRNCPKIIGAINEIYSPVTLEQSMKPQLMKRIVLTRFQKIDRKDRRDMDHIKCEKYYKDLISYSIYIGYKDINVMSLEHMLDTLSMGDIKNIHPDIKIEMNKGSRACTEIMAEYCNTDVDNFLSCVEQLNPKYIDKDSKGMEYLMHVIVPVKDICIIRSDKMDLIAHCYSRLEIDYRPGYFSVSVDLMRRVEKYRYYAAKYTKIYEKTLDSVMKLMARCAMNPITAVSIVYGCDLNTLLHIIDTLKVNSCPRDDAERLYKVIRENLREVNDKVNRPYYNERVFAALDEMVRNPQGFNITLSPTAIEVYKHMRDVKMTLSKDAIHGRFHNEITKLKLDDLLLEARKIHGHNVYPHRKWDHKKYEDLRYNRKSTKRNSKGRHNTLENSMNLTEGVEVKIDTHI